MVDKKDKNKPKKGVLSAEDVKIWRDVTGDIKPFHAPQEIIVAKATETQKDIYADFLPLPKVTVRKDKFVKAAPHVLDKGIAQKLSRGDIAVQARIDLHGMIQDQAHAALEKFIVAAQKNNKRCILVITGKGGVRDETRGVLRKFVPLWLTHGMMGEIVLSYATAKPQDGGAGALYVYLRKKH